MSISTHPERVRAHALYIQMIDSIRSYLKEKEYREVLVPAFAPALIPESHLEVFKTEYRYFADTKPLYLIPAQELFMKRLLAYGVGDCFTIGSVFRNGEGSSSLHSSQFMMLEYYRIGKGYREMVPELMGLLKRAAEDCFGRGSITYKNRSISFDSWNEMTVAEAFEKYASINRHELFDHPKFHKAAEKKGYNTENASYEELFSQIYAHEIEPKLGRSEVTILYDYPKEFAATAALLPDKKTAARFDLYIEGIEVGNCYSESTDANQIQARITAQAKKRRQLKKIDHPIDKGFVDAIQYGLKSCAGVTIGIDRLGMLFADVESVQDLHLITIS